MDGRMDGGVRASCVINRSAPDGTQLSRVSDRPGCCEQLRWGCPSVVVVRAE